MSIEIRDMTSDDIKQMFREHEALNPDMPIRQDIKEALDRWGDRGLPPGDFLRAVLENDLMKAMGRADSYNRATIFQITQYVYSKLPSTCWGSPEVVDEWKYFKAFRGASSE